MMDEAAIAVALRLSLGVLPAIIGWIAMLVLQQGQADAAIAILVIAFGFVIVFEQRASSRGLMPQRYILLRWALTVTVVAVLVVRVGDLHLHA